MLNFYGHKLAHAIIADQSPAKVVADILQLAVKN
jgi:hypothetical protein